MSIPELIEAILVAFGVGAVLLSCVGLWAMESVFDRLHYLGLATVLGPLAIAIAVLVRHSSAQAVIKMVLITVFLLVISPIVTHATAKAARVRQQGGIELERSEKGDVP